MSPGVLVLIAFALALLTALLTRRRARLLPALLLFPAVMLGAGLLTMRSASADGFALEIVTSPDAEGAISLSNVLYSGAVSELNDATSEGSVRLYFGSQTGSAIKGLPALTANNARLFLDDDLDDLTIIADTEFLGQNATVLVSARWDHTDPAGDFDPELAVVLRFDSVDLSVLNEDWSEFPLELTNALVGLANTEHTLIPTEKLGTKDFFSDGLDHTTDNLLVRPSGVALQAVIGDSPIAEGAELLGAVEAIKIKGTLGDSGTVLADGEEKTTKGLDLTADITVNTPPALAESGINLDTSWSLTIKANPGTGAYSAAVSGNAKLDLGDDDPFSFGASLAISYNSTTKASSFTLTGTVGDLDNLFGQEWFDLKELKLSGTVSRDANQQTSIAVSASANFSLADVQMTAALSVKNNTGTGERTLGVTLGVAHPIDIADIMNALGAPTMDDAFKVTLTDFGLHISATSGGTAPSSLTVAATGGAKLLGRDACAGESQAFEGAEARLLFRLSNSGSTNSFFVGGRLSGLTLHDISCDIPFEWTLPTTMITVSNTAIDTPWAQLDAPTRTFLQPVLCPTGIGVPPCPLNAKVETGFNLTASVTFDAAMKDALATLGMNVDGPLLITGTLPIFGGTTTNLKVTLPEISGGTDDLVSRGVVSFSISGDTGGVQAKIAGDMELRISRPNQDNCDNADGKFSDGTCYDTVNLNVGIGVKAAIDPPGIELELSGFLNDWQNAFGEPNLTIKQLALTLGIKADATGVGLNIGMNGSLLIGDTDLVLSMKVEVGGPPPRILLKGFTVGSAKGISLQELVRQFAPDINPNDLPPNFSIKNIWLAFGVEADAALCIRQGFYLSAELHLNDPNPSGDVGTNPVCGTQVRDGELRTCTPNQSSCLAAVLVDIRPTGFRIYGALSGFDLGPIAFDGAEVLIDVSPLKQEFYLKGAATLYDPIEYYIPPTGTDQVWASGYIHIEFAQSGGKLRLALTGCALIGGKDKADENCVTTATTWLQAFLKGSITADFTKPGMEFFEHAHLDITASLSSPAMAKLIEDIEEELKPVVEWFDNAAKTLEGTTTQVINDVEQQFCASFDPNCESLKVAAENYKNAPAYLDAQMAATDRAIKDSAALNVFCGLTFQWPVHECVQEYRDAAKAQFNSAISAAGGRERIARFGIDRPGFGGIRDSDFPDVWYVNPVHLKWPGSGPAPCAVGGNLHGLSICTGSGGTVNLDDLTGPALRARLEELDPTLAALFRNDDASAQGIQALALAQNEVDNGQFIAGVKKLGATFDMGNPLAICRAQATFRWNGADGPQPPAPNLATSTDAWGGKSIVELSVTNDGEDANLDLTNFKLALLQSLLEGGTDDLDCPDGTEDADPAPLTLAMSATVLDEGQSLTLTGTAPTGKIVTIDWADGSAKTTVTASSTRSWSASHTYTDGPRSFIVSASITEPTTSVYGVLAVRNVAPGGLQLNASAVIDEGQSVTLTGTFTDPGTLDTQAVIVDWGDGNTTELSLAADARAFTATHTYADDDPTLTPEDDYEISVRVTDKDGGATTGTRTLTVRNVAPTDLQFTATTSALGEGVVDEDGNLIVPEGMVVTLQGSFRDPGLTDTHSVQVLWPDGTMDSTAETTRDEHDPSIAHFSFSHVFADDHPATSTPSDLLDVRLAVYDDDSGETATDLKVRVQNLAPALSLNGGEQTVQYSDPIANVVLVANDVRGEALEDDAWSETLTAATRWQVDGGEWQDGLPAGLSFAFEACTHLVDESAPAATARLECEWSVTGIADVAPGEYTIRFVVTDDDTGVTTIDHVLTVEPEDARVDYTGPTIASAPSVLSGSIAVELRTMVRDISVVPGVGPGDEHPGDITNATVTFVNRATGAALCTAQVTQAFPSDTTTGVAACTATFATTGTADSWQFDVGIVVGGWYTRDDAADNIELLVRRPNKDEIHGNHFVTASSPAGTTAPTERTRVTGSVHHVAFAKNFSAFSGGIQLEFTSNGRSYRAEVTSIDSLGILRGPKHTTNQVEVEARVTLYDVTNKKQQVTVGTDLRLQLRYLDVHAPGTPDTMAFAIWDPSGMLVSAAHWDTVTLSGAVLAGGQILVK